MPTTPSTSRRSTRLAALSCAVLLAAAPSAASAASGSGTLPVSATVLSSATVLATPIVFGNYDAVGTAGTTGSSLLTVIATLGTPYTLGLDAGTGPGATVANRKMTSGSNTLDYTVYSDSARTNVWGNTAGTNTVAGTGNGLAQIYTAYGLIPGGQKATTGLYGDTVTVTVTYYEFKACRH